MLPRRTSCPAYRRATGLTCAQPSDLEPKRPAGLAPDGLRSSPERPGLRANLLARFGLGKWHGTAATRGQREHFRNTGRLDFPGLPSPGWKHICRLPFESY